MSRKQTNLPVPELYSGDRLSQAEFHRIYATRPEDFKAELIGGTVYVSSPLKRRHATCHVCLGTLLGTYEAQTPGVEAGDNATVILGEEDEAQPDLYLRVLPQYGGRTRSTAHDYIEGAPELISEVAHSSRSIDLHAKKGRYRRHGVGEYVVVCLRERQVRWFDLASGGELFADAAEIFRSQLFPGLWLHGPALLARDYPRLLSTLGQGLASDDHAAFVRTLSERRSKLRKRRPKR